MGSKRVQRYILKSAGYAIITCVLVMITEIIFNHTSAGRELHQAGEDFVLPFLTTIADSNDFPVIIDITDIRPSGAYLLHPDSTVTSRYRLWKLLKQILNCQPKAIGIDIDFAPSNDLMNSVIVQRDPSRDYTFFENCQIARQKWNVPIYLGVYGTRMLPSDYWLTPDTTDCLDTMLAASLALEDDPRLDVYSLVHSSYGGVPLKSLALRLWCSSGKAGSENCRFCLWNADSVNSRSPSQSGQTPWLINLDVTCLERLEATTIHVSGAEDIDAVAAEALRGKCVIIGCASRNGECDLRTVPGSDRLYPGVLIHAAAIVTLSRPVIRQIHWSVLPIANLVTLFSLYGFLFARNKSIQHGSQIEHASKLFSWSFAILTLVSLSICGVIVAFYFRLVWDEIFINVFFVFAALTYESKLHNRLMKVDNWIRKKLSGRRRKIDRIQR